MNPTAAIAYQTLIARVHTASGEGTTKCRVLLDSGSAGSFATEKLIKRLENGNCSIPVEVKTIPTVTTVGNPAPLKLKERYADLKDVYFTDVTKECNLEVEMLLGSQHLAEILTGQIHKGRSGEPVAVKSLTLAAPRLYRHTECRTPRNASISEDVSRLWDLETLGIKEEDPVHMAFEEDIRFTGKIYSVPLPWREGKFKVPMNRGLAEGRLNNQLKKLKKTPDILKEYDAIIQQQLEEGIVERVPENATGQRVT
eukprot:gene5100-biopygen4161